MSSFFGIRNSASLTNSIDGKPENTSWHRDSATLGLRFDFSVSVCSIVTFFRNGQ